MSALFVVGNKFGQFGSNRQVITLGQLARIVKEQGLQGLPDGTRLVAGQGVREADIVAVCQIARGTPAGHRVDVVQMAQRPVRASGLHTHKHKLHNSIVSFPVRVSDDVYELALLLDERSELMGDHQTGQHIQGMVLIEAARQAFLAVTEEFFIGHGAQERYYFVINRMDTTFNSFVFPLDATLRYEILSKDVSNRGRMQFDTRISVLQAGTCATQVAVRFTAFLAERIEAREQQMAATLLDQVASRSNEDTFAATALAA